MAQWEFYGRATASRKLARLLAIDPAQQGDEPRFFAATGLGGRRGVGKNTLLEHVVAQHGRADRLLVVTLDDFGRDTMAAHEAEALFLATMEETIRERDLDHLCRDLVPRGDKITDAGRLIQIIRHLVYKDMIVALDEVHNILGTRLPSRLMRFIDDQTKACRGILYATGQPPPTGQLVLMGSHQQKFGQLQDAKAPLAGRFRTVQLRPWSLATVMDIAQAHGWDQRPGRFHTLWTAYDGMPREWERFAQSRDAPPELRKWEPPSGDPVRDHAADQDWRRALVRHERAVLERDSRQRWDSKAYVELAKPLIDAIIWMGQNRVPGQVIPGQDIVGGIVREARANEITLDPPLALGDLNDRLEALERDTDIVRQRHHFIGRIPGFARPCWSLNDNATLFQLCIAPDLFPPRYRPATTPPGETDDMIRALETLEGTALERLTAGWLLGHPHVREAYAGAEPAGPKGETQPDIDVLARLKQKATGRGPQDLLVLGNAKRDSREHDVAAFRCVVNGFMARGQIKKDDPEYSPEIARVCQLPHTLIFVSPVFQPNDRERIQAAGHLAFDIGDMATERRNGWPLLHERLEWARTAGPAQEIGMAPPAPPKPRRTEVNRQVEEPQPPDKMDDEPQP